MALLISQFHPFFEMVLYPATRDRSMISVWIRGLKLVSPAPVLNMMSGTKMIEPSVLRGKRLGLLFQFLVKANASDFFLLMPP